MNRKTVLTIVSVVLVAIIAIVVRQVAFAKERTVYRFAPIARGDMEATVSATGTLNSVTTVSVGTQVSGQISKLLVDFNDHVKKGQLLATIDPTLALQGVADAQANLQKAEAQAVQAGRDNRRNAELMNDGLVARSAYEQTQSDAEVASASVKSAQVALDRARQNLAYTNIYSPIDGVIVERNVQQGQTVAASLSAPQLFLIANDLSNMQILAQVGESDIAQIKQGQTADFTVQALPNRTFQGTVSQVRLQSTTQDNVVNYTVVVSVDNSRGQLMPGMTARVNFLTKSADNVLKVPNAALRFRPANMTTTPTSTALKTAMSSTGSRGNWSGQHQHSGDGGRPGVLYTADAKGNLTAHKVVTGITDGTTTEVRGTDIKEGMNVVTGTISSSQPQSASAAPFGGQQQGGQRGGMRGGF